ncbi:diguanylate cyclase [uncultured Massilia sp.]|uniref:GGDEF domain-containing protein n=1 Tax=uncultured Massilia sp. TaxID=169973 RepID=UPI0025E1769A|nr:GGDEF domain-containing protein [uncultured Massilia sp.]
MIDIQTFMLALGAGNIAFALLMAGYMRSAPPDRSLNAWMWARLATGVAQTSAWLAPYFGRAALVDFASFAWIAGTALEMAAYCMFFGFRRWRLVLYPAAAVALLAVAGAIAAGATRQQMAWVVAVLVALFASASAMILLRPQKDAPPVQRIIGTVDAMFALAIWIWMAVANGRMGNFNASPILGFAYLSSYLLMIVNGFGFLLLCKMRDDAGMRRLATIDGLTDTLNRRAFFERADGARLLALRMRKPIALAMLDLDHFKQLNDGFGHACGDEALRVFAATARGLLREHDLMGRLGGEEFALALPGVGLDGALKAAERLRLAVTEAALPSCAAGYRMTVSIGVVVIEPNEELTAALARADHALYAAKTGGRNRVEVGPALLKRA